MNEVDALKDAALAWARSLNWNSALDVALGEPVAEARDVGTPQARLIITIPVALRVTI